ncbi:MAG: hypothetical protein KAH56_08895 [Candidatus Krumholzibacteria bacterium]|nr:hypothetical protein [Candidatus Krumholzibacteria bacterium]
MPDTTSDNAARLPDVTLTAAGSEREVKLGQLGVPVILVFHGQDTGDAAIEVNKAVRKQHAGVDEVFIASVIDLRSFPSMFRGMVQPALEKAYHNAAGRLPAEADAADLVVLLPDWEGSVHDAVGVKGSTEKAAVVVADREARIVCIDQGDNLAEAVLAALAGLVGT